MDDIMRAGLERGAEMMHALCAIGAGGSAMAMANITRSIYGMPELDAELYRYLTGPIVCHSGGSGWGPEWDGHPVHREIFRNQVAAERCSIALEVSPYLVGPTELMLVLYTFSVDAPMTHEGGALYLWAAAHAMAKQAAYNTLGAVQDMVFGGSDKGGHDRLSDADVLEPETQVNQLYAATCREIRRKVANRSGKKHRIDHTADYTAVWSAMDLPTRLEMLVKHDRPVSEAILDRSPML